MKSKVLISVLVFISLFLIQCSKDNASEEAQKAGVNQTDDSSLQGQLQLENAVINYSVNATLESIYKVSIDIDGNIIEATVDYNKEDINVNGHDVTLTREQKIALLETGQALSDYVLNGKENDITMAEHTLISLVDYWSRSPEGYTHNKLNYEGKRSAKSLNSANEGITCIRRNRTVNAEYDDASGFHSDPVVVGSRARATYGCMGRCGADCGRWWIPSAWTKDCLDHDQCSHINNASGGSGDSNCGDEFDQAIDDYVFGVIRGCNGR